MLDIGEIYVTRGRNFRHFPIDQFDLVIEFNIKYHSLASTFRTCVWTPWGLMLQAENGRVMGQGKGGSRRICNMLYSRTNMLLMRVAGRQNTITRMSARARLTMKQFVTVRIRGALMTTAITKLFPMSPTENTMAYATQYTAVMVKECRQKSSFSCVSELTVELYPLPA